MIATAQMLYSDIRSLIVWLRTFQNIAAPLLARKNPASVGLDPSPLNLYKSPSTVNFKRIFFNIYFCQLTVSNFSASTYFLNPIQASKPTINLKPPPFPQCQLPRHMTKPPNSTSPNPPPSPSPKDFSKQMEYPPKMQLS
jgi:hypothetical protein